ncbi:MAG: FG-GAP-like repeat-containing protein [Opitutaceae bacterium]
MREPGQEPLSSERLRMIREIFEQAADLSEDERGLFLERACGGDRDLHGRISALLAETESGDSPFDDLMDGMIRPALESLSRNPHKAAEWLDGNLQEVPEEDPLIGRTISRFEILESIGRGGMGMVYRARDRTLDRMVALKFLPPSLSADPDAKERFIHEAKAASGLNHPNIATVHEIAETVDHQMFIAMGYYPGQTLTEKIKGGPLPVDEALDIAVQLVSGLQKAHEQGVTHRDIKPGNIMITGQGTVVLLDFGLAKLSNESGYTQIGQMAGTLAYMSPEQAMGGVIDGRTDIWSFGVVLYEMLTGKRPFGGNAQSAVRAILDEDPVSPVDLIPGLPRSCDEVLARCLAKNPDHRYQNVTDLLDDLRSARDGSPAKRHRGRAPWKRRFRLRTVLMAAVSAVVILTALLLWPRGLGPLPAQPADGPVAVAVGGPPAGEREGDGEDETVRILREVWRQNPDHADAARALGIHFDYRLQRHDDAMLWYRRAYALENWNPNLPNRIGDLYRVLGDLEAAVWWTERALRVAPESDLANSLQVKVHLLRGEVDEALAFFRENPTGRLPHAVGANGDPLLLALPYYGSGLGAEQAEDSVSLLPLLDALLAKGRTEQALGFCRTHFAAESDPPGDDPGRATFRVAADPFEPGGDGVLEFDPGFLRGEIWEWNPGHVITRWHPRHRSAAIRLPPAARITASGRRTLYLRIGRPAFDPRTAVMDFVWGLASSAGSSDYAAPTYGDLSIQSRYAPDGGLELRDGTAFVELVAAPTETAVFHELWYVVDPDSNTFDVHIRGGRRFPDQTAIFREAHYRKETREALDLLVLVQNTGQAPADLRRRLPVYVDDIWVYPDGENLGVPGEGWVPVDDFEDGELSGWMRRLVRCDHLLDITRAGLALGVVRTLQAAGRKEAAGNLLDGIEATVESTWLPDRNENRALWARIHALRGDRAGVLTDLRTLFASGQTGWYWDGLLRRDEWEPYLDDPEIRAAFAELDRVRDTQLARIRKMEQQGELAAIPMHLDDVRPLTAVSFTRLMSGPALDGQARFIGQGWGDYDGDGLVDLVLAEQGRAIVHLYRNLGGGAFRRDEEGIAATGLKSPNQPVWADQDNDGDLDLFIATDDDQIDGFYRNDGRGGLAREYSGVWVETPTSSDNAAWGDYDNDGFVDLYVTSNMEPNRIYRNNGDGTMTPVANEANQTVGFSDGLAWSDFDGDGDVDLFIGGQDEVQFRNEGNGTFSWVSSEEGGVPSLADDLSLSSADFDNDGDLDLLCCTWKTAAGCHLFRNEGASGFYDAVRAIPSAASVAANGSAWGDFDNDGWIDFFIANGNGSNLLYHNEGGDRFRLVVPTPPVDDKLGSLRCAWVDFDNDGDLDLSVTNEPIDDSGHSFQLFRNEGGTNHWIMIRLVGTVSNRTAFGAKVRVRAVIGGREISQLRQIGGNGDTPGELRAHFGLGDASVIETLRVEWPSGMVQELNGVTVDQLITIEESAPEREPGREERAVAGSGEHEVGPPGGRIRMQPGRPVEG